jgi:hypothetical protein
VIKNGMSTIKEKACSINTIRKDGSSSVTESQKGASVAQSMTAKKTRNGEKNLSCLRTVFYV